MNSYERTVKFVSGEKTDHPPFMPLVVDWAAKQQNADYMDFVNKPEVRADVYIKTAKQFNIDCILPDVDFYEQLSNFGMELRVIENRYKGFPFIEDLEKDIKNINVPEIKSGTRMGNRLETLKIISKKEKGNYYIFGICVGPFTEFCNARGISKTVIDIMKNKEIAKKYIELFYENCMQFIKAQLESGADGIQIVEPSCSLISPKLYEELVQPYHKKMVKLVQEYGGITRLHVCGNTMPHLEKLLETGTNVLDVDFQVDMAKAASKLGENQYLCGNLDPAGVLLGGTPEQITELTKKIYKDTNNRTIMSSGCDVPQDSPVENIEAFYKACASLK